jgi:hypothetical protein
VLAWLADEKWKLETYRRYDATGKPEFEPYCVMASRALKRTVTPDDEVGRGFGKTYDLAFGFGGGVGAWRKFDPTDTYSDAEIEQFKGAYRTSHPATFRLWHQLERAAHRCVRTGKPTNFGWFYFSMENSTLFMTLPSGRRLAYPEARLVPGKFENTHNVRYKDNAKGGWSDCDAWYGTLVENAVQATARDLLAAAMLRLENAGYSIVLTVHDEIVCEVPKEFGSVEDFHRLITELPVWATGLPIAAKVWTRNRYAKSTTAPTVAASPSIAPPESADSLEVGEPQDDGDDERVEVAVPLSDLIGEPVVGGKVLCPFHNDTTPSLHIYSGNYHCFVCGAHGDQIDWLVQVEGMEREEAVYLLDHWDGPITPVTPNDPEITRAFALRLWSEAQPVTGTLAVKYLADVRKIDVDALPAGVPLGFHPHCPFGPGLRSPCLIALYQDIETDAPVGIHRIALTPDVFDGAKVQRMSLGSWPRARAIKLWPPGPQLVVGEGVETALAGAMRFCHDDAPLRPAWSLVSSDALGRLPVIAGVERLIILVDHDAAGLMASDTCTARWTGAGRTVIALTPDPKGTDFNDLIMPSKCHG